MPQGLPTGKRSQSQGLHWVEARHLPLPGDALCLCTPDPLASSCTGRDTEPADSVSDTHLASQATWLFFRREADLREEEKAQLSSLLQASPKAKVVYHLVEAFLHMVRERTGEEQLEAWLKEVEASQLEAFASFVTSLQQDKDAVLAALTLPRSTGPKDRTHQWAQADQKTGLWAREV
jgi:hypothetical protein